MQKFIIRNSANFKGFLFVFGILIIVSTLWYTQELVNALKIKSTEYIRFRLKVFEENINNPNSTIDVGFFFNEVIQGADYPIIYTDANRVPQSWTNISPRLDSAQTLSPPDSILLYRILNQISAENDPIPIKYQGAILGYYYYGLPPEIYRLRNLPYIAIFSAIVFILFGYLGFNYIKRNEQGNIWVGMAKETAHQLGTPLSSLAGWIELFKADRSGRNFAVYEMSNDLQRLNKIANRFSKIGSIPKLNNENLKPIIEEVCTYFRKRLPNIQKKIKISHNLSEPYSVQLNKDLFEWVLENLIKNAIDSIENESGLISINVSEDYSGKKIYIDIVDNGKGIPISEKTRIFKPGFSTKKRGWGLGLSLAKRIVEEYHDGKLILKESKFGSGSIFRITLRKQ